MRKIVPLNRGAGDAMAFFEKEKYTVLEFRVCIRTNPSKEPRAFQKLGMRQSHLARKRLVSSGLYIF